MTEGIVLNALSAHEREIMRAILHIGLQKTGTSSIQVMLASSAKYLEEIGYAFPELPKSETEKSNVWVSPFRHNCVAATYADFNSVFEKMNRREENEFWRKPRESGLVPIISAEEFSRQRDFTLIADAMVGYEVEVVLYLRRQDYFMESLYNQRNKILVSRGDPSFLEGDFLSEDDLFHFIEISGYDKIMNYVDLLDRIRTQMNPEKIHVRNFDRAALISQDVCSDFCHVVGVNLDAMKVPKLDANQSISNQALIRLKGIYAVHGKVAARDAMKNLSALTHDRVHSTGGYRIFSDKTRSKILQNYQEVNRNLSEKYQVNLI